MTWGTTEPDDADRVSPWLAAWVAIGAVAAISLAVIAGNVSGIDSRMRDCTTVGRDCYQRQHEDLMRDVVESQITVTKCRMESDTPQGVEACIRLDVDP